MAFLKFNKAELVNLSYSLKREIICANKTGAYCNTSIVTCNTRRYHGLLGVPVDNFGGSKYMLLSSVDESLSVNGKMFNLGIHCYGEIYEPRGHKYIVDFMADPVPTVVYRVGEMEFVKSILLAPDKDQVMIRYELRRSPAEVELYLKPFLAFRNIHSLTKQNSEARTDYEDIRNGVSFNMYQGFPDLNLQLSNSGFTFKSSPYWYNGITYSDEARRGFDCKEDLFVPGSFTLKMKEGDSIILSASVEEENPRMITRKFNAALKGMKGIGNYHDQLLHCADLLTRDRNGHKMITAGFSWLYTGLLRETMFSLPGFTIATGKLAEFEEILDNIIADNEERFYCRTTQVEADALHYSSGICQCRCACEKGMEQIRRCGEESHRKLCSRMQKGNFPPAERPSLGTERQNCIDMDECLYRRLSCHRKIRLSGGDQCFLVRYAVLRHRDGKQVWPQDKRIRGEMVSGKRYGGRELPEDVLDAGQGISC